MTLPAIITQVGPYPVKFVGAHISNQWATDDGLPKEGVVCHIMDGTLAGCDSWFNTPGAFASTNFGISKRGEIHQYVKLVGAAPYANGVKKDETAKVARMLPLVRQLSEQYGWRSQNKWTLSIEHEGRSGEQITDYPAMFDASTRLCAMLLADAPLERQRTFEHQDFDAVTRAGCPGWSTATWEAYDGRVQELLGNTPLPPVPPAGGPLKEELDGAWDALHRAMKEHTTATDHLSTVYRILRERGIIEG
jgi:hypothetical protein